MTPAVATDALTKRYGRDRGIEDVTLTIGPGEAFGLLGPNGAGKTTFIRALTGLLHPTSGSARIFGIDSRRVEARERVGVLPGDFACDPRLTGWELLRLCAAIRSVGDLGSARSLAERFRADLDRPIGELSRGNRQKIGLIQAFFHRPELVVLDEPTSGLDPLMQEAFVHLVAERRAEGDTILMSSHDLDEVQRACDRVGIVRDGRLVDVERVEDLRRRSLHHVRVELSDPAGAETLRGIAGVQGLVVHDRVVLFDVSGPIDPVIKQLGRLDVLDLDIGKPSLEEAFLTFYGKDAG